MLERIKVVELDLGRPLVDITGLNDGFLLKAVLYLHGQYIGKIYEPVSNGFVSAEKICDSVLAKYAWEIISTLLKNGVFAAVRPLSFSVENLWCLPAMEPSRGPSTEIVRVREDFVYDSSPAYPESIAIRTVDLSKPLDMLDAITDYQGVRIFVLWQSKLLGSVDIANYFQSISKVQLCETIVNQLGFRLLEPQTDLSQAIRQARAIASLRNAFLAGQPISEGSQQLADTVPVSIVIGTYDRPDDLNICLKSLTQQTTRRSVEIIVVDNHPESELTSAVVSNFHQVRLIREPRQGVAYARNAGIAASTGEIIITVDDDITAPHDWLEKLLAPFAQVNIMAVTGNVLPLELETDSQNIFENYGSGGLSRGFERVEAGKKWFDAFEQVGRVVPTWNFGGTANAAFRTDVFNNPTVGLMNEALGPGMPSGVGEDIYLFYRLLKADLKIVYEPKAFVWHKHRRTMEALKRQLYNYSKGYVSYQLTTLFNDRAPGVVKNLLVDIPAWHMSRIMRRLQKRSSYPIPLVLVEMMGHLAGPWSLWKAHQKVQKLGKSQPYLPPRQNVENQQAADQPKEKISFNDSLPVVSKY